MWLSRSHQRIGNENLLVARKLGQVADLAGKEAGYSENCLDHSVTALKDGTID